MAEEKMIMTKEGMAKLEEEYRHLIDVERPDVIEQLKAARSQGDLSENADYDAARNRQAQIEGRITEIEHIKDIAEVVDASKIGKKIFLGNLVTFKDLSSGETSTVKIVGTLEADPLATPNPLISKLGKRQFVELLGRPQNLRHRRAFPMTNHRIRRPGKTIPSLLYRLFS
jgi:transcription elongation factor GreA